jgi:hypothetical protein
VLIRFASREGPEGSATCLETLRGDLGGKIMHGLCLRRKLLMAQREKWCAALRGPDGSERDGECGMRKVEQDIIKWGAGAPPGGGCRREAGAKVRRQGAYAAAKQEYDNAARKCAPRRAVPDRSGCEWGDGRNRIDGRFFPTKNASCRGIISGAGWRSVNDPPAIVHFPHTAKNG